MQKVKISKRVGRQLYRSSPTILTVVACQRCDVVEDDKENESK